MNYFSDVYSILVPTICFYVHSGIGHKGLMFEEKEIKTNRIEIID